MRPADGIRLFALNARHGLGARVAACLGIPLAPHEERRFEDGEHKARPLENVRGRDVFVLESLYGEPDMSVNDKLCRLLFFIGALKDAAAGRVTAVVPYLCYARKDRRSKARDPVTTRYVARLFEAAATDRVVTLDVHNLAAFENAFRCGIDHLEAQGLIADHFIPQLGAERVVVVSPDVGGVKRAERFRQLLAQRLAREPGSAFLEKHRSSGVVSGEAVVGEVAGATAIIIDDLISTGGTIQRAVRACRERGAARVFAAASHGVFVGEAARLLTEPALDALVVTDAIPPFRIDPALAREKLVVLETAPLIAEAIRRIHDNGSLVELLEASASIEMKRSVSSASSR